MSDTDDRRLERRGLAFLHALRRGDAEGLAALWVHAIGDPALAEMFEALLADGTPDEPALPRVVVRTRRSGDPPAADPAASAGVAELPAGLTSPRE